MGFIKARGCSFYYEEQGEGPPILLIPPSGATASTWGALPDDLATVGRVIAYDRRGYSRSGGEVVRAVVVHDAVWRALRHPGASGRSTLARMQWLAWRGRYPDAAETLLRWVYSYRDGGSAWDAFPEQWRQTARENG